MKTFFNKKDKIKKHAGKIDKLVTGIIIGWAVASIIWLSKKKKKESISKNIQQESKKVAKKWVNIFGKILVWVVKVFSKKK